MSKTSEGSAPSHLDSALRHAADQGSHPVQLTVQALGGGGHTLLLLLHLPPEVVLRPSQSQQLCTQLLTLSQLFVVGLSQRLVVLPQGAVLLGQALASLFAHLQTSRGGLELPYQLVSLRFQLCYDTILI